MTSTSPRASSVEPTAVAVVVCRDGRLPVGAIEAVAEAGGHAVVVGTGAQRGALLLPDVVHVRWSDTGPGLRPAALAEALVGVLAPHTLVVLPDSPDGRDLAPRLSAVSGRPLLARVMRAEIVTGDVPGVRAQLTRIDDRVLVPVEVPGPAIVTLAVGGRPAVPDSAGDSAPGGIHEALALDLAPVGRVADPELVALLEPDLRTMDLADATRVLGGGAGLVVGQDDRQAGTTFALLVAVAAGLGGSAGATRVATDAGWTGYERQIGTTGVAVDPDLYVAFGVAGATQHTGGLGAPRHVVSVNTDPSCPMTAMADLGLVTDAHALLVELARRLDIVPSNAARSEVGHA
jgi:electron transfer flavoprotein alpha subunit